jgi:hypothetical protein
MQTERGDGDAAVVRVVVAYAADVESRRSLDASSATGMEFSGSSGEFICRD